MEHWNTNKRSQLSRHSPGIYRVSGNRGVHLHGYPTHSSDCVGLPKIRPIKTQLDIERGSEAHASRFPSSDVASVN